MKLVKSLLLGSAAGFVAVAGASAADLPSRKAAPAEYVKVCSAYGAGFFYIPGTDVCLKIGGFARYQWQYFEPAGAGDSQLGTRAQGRFELDARNPTAYGTLRTFVRLDVAFRTGSERSGSAVRAGYGFDNTAAADAGQLGRAQTQVILDKAFVQWGGFIAGRAASLFDFNKAPELIGTLPVSALYPGTNLIGYIATFGAGFYASVSAEDAIQRRQALSNAGTTDAIGSSLGGAFNGLNPAGSVSYYGGFRMPDIVAALGVEQSWGAAQISGAVHQIDVTPSNNVNTESKYGWAVQGGVMVNLPMISPGDYLWLNAAYAEGAMSYVHSDWFGAQLNFQSVKNSNQYWDADGYINGLTGSVSLSKTYGISGAFQHYWTPTLRSGFFAGWSQFNNPGAIADWDYWNYGANIIWSPVRALDIGIEGAVENIKGRNVATDVFGTPLAGTVRAAGLKNEDHAFIVRFRVQRTF